MNELNEKLREEIAAAGCISFARFMELALYCPLCGFYEREQDTIGRRGDYYTSVSVGSLFGELLARQFAGWLGELGTRNSQSGMNEKTAPLQLVEAGAHDGQLARDILRWLRSEQPELFARLEYWIIEPSARRREWQAQTLSDFAPHVCWFTDFQAFGTDQSDAISIRHSSSVIRYSGPVRGVIFGNELLDAMPVHRLRWEARQRAWFEWGVGLRGRQFTWCKLPNAIPPTAQAFQSRFQLPVCPFDLPPQLLDVLPDGFVLELSPTALYWWQRAAAALQRGRLLAIDYGLSAGEFLASGRSSGTLRAYHRHRFCADLLANPGEQDLTAHVNFTALQAVGEQAGLCTDGHFTQAQFLTRIVERTEAGAPNVWTPARARQLQTLIHPEHLGRAFQVLIQSRMPPTCS